MVVVGEEGVDAFAVGESPGLHGSVVGGSVEEAIGVVVTHAGDGVFVKLCGFGSRQQQERASFWEGTHLFEPQLLRNCEIPYSDSQIFV